jgi:hypothetical protein
MTPRPFVELVIIQQEWVENTGPAWARQLPNFLQQHRANSVARIDPAILSRLHGRRFYRRFDVLTLGLVSGKIGATGRQLKYLSKAW